MSQKTSIVYTLVTTETRTWTGRHVIMLTTLQVVGNRCGHHWTDSGQHQYGTNINSSSGAEIQAK